MLRERLGAAVERAEATRATFLGWLDREAAGAPPTRAPDLFLFCSRTDTYGQVIAEAQASGLPVVAVGRGRARVR